MRKPDIRAAGAVLYSPERDAFLLLKHRRGHWAFPQGKLEGDEDVLEAMKREVEEETGVAVDDVDEEFEIRVTYRYQHRRKKILKEVIFYLVVTDDQITISDEHRGYLWLPYDKALAQLKFKNHTDALTGAAKRLVSRGVRPRGFTGAKK